MSTPFKHRAEYAAFRLLHLLTRLLPRRAALAFGRRLGDFVWRVVRFRRRIITENLQAAFPAESKADPAWLDATACRFYRHLGMTLLEFLAAGHRTTADLQRQVKLEGAEHLTALQERGQGAVFVSGHLGNFELMLPRAAASGIRVHGVVKPQSNRLIDRFHNGIRQRDGVGIIPTGGSFPCILAALEAGGFVGLLGDQDAGSKGLFVPFLGRAASVNRGPATLAVKAGCPLLMVFVERQPDNTHVMRIEAPLEVDPDWDEETAIRRLTEMHTARLEAAVRREPAMYYWLHRRWKTRPPGE